MPGIGVMPGWLNGPTLTEAPDAVQAIAWHPTQARCTVGLVGGEVLDWDLEDLVLRPRRAHEEGLLALIWSPSGDRLATAGQDGVVRVWHHDGHLLATLTQQTAWIHALAWSSDGGWLAVGSGRYLELWDLRATEAVCVARKGPHASTISDITWLPAKAGVAVAAYGGVTIWPSPESGSIGSQLKGLLFASDGEASRHLPFKGSLLKLAVSPDGRFYATGNQDGTVHLWYATSGQDLEMDGYATKVRELAWDPRSRFIATGGSEDVTIWDMRGRGPAGSKPLVLEGHEAFVTALDCQPVGDLLASCGRDGRVCFWRPMRGPDLRGRELQGMLKLGEPAVGVSWRPDGKQLVAAGQDGRLLTVRVNR